MGNNVQAHQCQRRLKARFHLVGRARVLHTLHNLLKRLDVVSLEAALTKWAFSKLEDAQVLKTQHLEGVAIDGKELCGSKDPETGYRTHLRCCFSR